MGIERWRGQAGWTAPALGAIFCGIVFLAIFLRVESRLGDAAMTPISLFNSSDFIGLTVLTFLLYGALSALLVLAPYVLIQAAGISATAAGAALSVRFRSSSP